MLENYQALAQTAADKHWSHLDYLTELLGGEASARRRSPRAALHQAGTLPRAQDARPVRLELAHQDQPAAHPEPVPPGLRRQQRQRRVHLRHRAGQEPSDDRARPRRVPARTLGAVHRRHRHHQHAGRRARQRQHQARAEPLHQTPASCASTNSATCPSTSSAPTACSRSSATATSAAPR